MPASALRAAGGICSRRASLLLLTACCLSVAGMASRSGARTSGARMSGASGARTSGARMSGASGARTSGARTSGRSGQRRRTTHPAQHLLADKPVTAQKWSKFSRWRNGCEPKETEKSHPIFYLQEAEYVCPFAQMAINSGCMPSVVSGEVRAFCNDSDYKNACSCPQCNVLCKERNDGETFRQCWNRLDRYADESPPASWLCSIVLPA